ncbi:MAG: VCBS repeat-containing protein [Proteobacteria bacterium]|nr:VCBS repeat-containing protein [Pseudomonadota bacterium]
MLFSGISTKTLIVLILFYSVSISATITFEAQQLTNSKQPNYLKFRYPTNDFGNTFETLAADFNGDGFEDILSLGGVTSNFGTGGVTFAIPLGMMLYDDGEFVIHDLGVSFASSVVNVIDIDQDGDLDIVTLTGYILVNDGLANFTVLEYNPGWMLGNNVFTIDWDNDGDFDIVTQKRIFINDGNLNFSADNAFPIDASHAGNIIYVADINNDEFIDFVISNGSVLQSWINDKQGQFTLQNSLDVADYIYQIHALDADDANNFSLILEVRDQGQSKILSLKNDGNGGFVASEFILDFANITFDWWYVEKMYNHDMNNDGINELLIATTFKNNSDCQNWQNLLFIYKKDDQGVWGLSDKLHAEGYQGDPNSSFASGKLTIPSIIDLNQDSLPDVILPGDKPIVWLSGSNSFNDDSYYYVSSRSMTQFTSTIDVVDFTTPEVASDNKLDIFQAIDMSNQCPVPDGTYTPKNFIRSILWINDGNDAYYSFSSELGGGNDFLHSYKYFKFVDVENTGSPSFIATRQYQDDGTAQSFYIDPRYIDPLFRIQLPEVTYFAESANLDLTDDTQELIMIADTADAPILVYKLNNGQLDEIARLNFGNKNGEFKLTDIDSDGNLDIIANDKGASNAIAIWYNDGQGQFTKGQSFGNNTQAIAIMDINDDGQLDIMTANATHDIWLQQAHNQFAKLDYDDSFWHAPVGAIEDYSRNWIPSSMQVQDINNDGKDDLIVYIQHSRRVYINESSSNHTWFYYIYDSYTGQDLRNNIIVSDLNNDNMLDFLDTSEDTIILNTQITINPTTGLFYDPDYSGHGYSIDNIGQNNLFYSIFYSYDNNGKPQWF